MDSLLLTNLLGCFGVSQLAQGDLIKVRQSYAEAGCSTAEFSALEGLKSSNIVLALSQRIHV